jgi:hypothetical protein
VALLLSERAFRSTNLKENLDSISLTDYREFAATDPTFDSYVGELNAAGDSCPQCSAQVVANSKFCAQCGLKIGDGASIITGLLEDPVDVLSISDRLRQRIRPRFPKVGHVVQAPRDELMTISYIKEVRSRIIKNAAEEYISG